MSGARVLPVVRHSLHGELVGRIRDMIIAGELAAGSRIHEGQLGLALGVSRTPLREALKFVASEGLIDLVPGRGGVVRVLTQADVREMLAVLCSLEVLAGRLACRVASDSEIAGVRVLHDRMVACYAGRQRLEYYKLNQAVHCAIAGISGNRFLASTHGAIQSRLQRIRFLGNDVPANWERAVGEHADIVSALERRDGDGLAEVLRRHMDQTWERVRVAM